MSNYKCDKCNKYYKTYQSFWNHNKLKHSDLNIKIQSNEKNFKCENCGGCFTRKFNLQQHIKNSCKVNKMESIVEMKQTINELVKKIKTLENKPIINNTTNNTTNNTINNIYINKPGTENVLELNDKEVNDIFSKEISGVISLVKYINFNSRLPSNHSFCSKSLEGKYLLTYNAEESKIESTRKKYFYQELLANAVNNLELLYKLKKGQIEKNKQEKIEDTIQRLKEITNGSFSNKILKEMLNYLTQLSYNSKDIVLETWNNPNNKIAGKKIIDTTEEENILKELANCDIVLQKNELNGIFSETDSDDFSESDESDSENFYELTSVKNKKNKEINL